MCQGVLLHEAAEGNILIVWRVLARTIYSKQQVLATISIGNLVPCIPPLFRRRHKIWFATSLWMAFYGLFSFYWSGYVQWLVRRGTHPLNTPQHPCDGTFITSSSTSEEQQELCKDFNFDLEVRPRPDDQPWTLGHSIRRSTARYRGLRTEYTP